MIKKGKFIVLEGIDGSGKSTQAKLIFKFLKKQGHKVKRIDFPQYGKKSAGLVEEYLTGKYGSLESVGPYRASIFYACDRYDASFEIKKWLNQGNIVVSDRYISSNAGHQGGKIKNKQQRSKYLKWLYDLEYGLFGIPKPDITFIFKVSPEWSFRLSSQIKDKQKQKKKASYLGKKKRDIHEKNKKHLKDTLDCYLELAQKYPRDFKVIECLDGKKLLSPLEIHEKAKKVILKYI